jgi:uncharacterized protein
MAIDVENLVIENNEADKQFQAKLEDGDIAFIEYMIAGEWIVFTHTEVPEKYEGMGIASKMARVALDYAREEGYRVQPLCPYIAMYIRRHPEYQPITLGYRRT